MQTEILEDKWPDVWTVTIFDSALPLGCVIETGNLDEIEERYAAGRGYDLTYIPAEATATLVFDDAEFRFGQMIDEIQQYVLRRGDELSN